MCRRSGLSTGVVWSIGEWTTYETSTEESYYYGPCGSCGEALYESQDPHTNSWGEDVHGKCCDLCV